MTPSDRRLTGLPAEIVAAWLMLAFVAVEILVTYSRLRQVSSIT